MLTDLSRWKIESVMYALWLGVEIWLFWNKEETMKALNWSTVKV